MTWQCRLVLWASLCSSRAKWISPWTSSSGSTRVRFSQLSKPAENTHITGLTLHLFQQITKDSLDVFRTACILFIQYTVFILQTIHRFNVCICQSVQYTTRMHCRYCIPQCNTNLSFPVWQISSNISCESVLFEYHLHTTIIIINKTFFTWIVFSFVYYIFICVFD